MRVNGRQLALGELIAALRCKDPEATVTFGFGGHAPTGVCSYRGYYEDLAIQHEQKYGVTVAEFLNMLEAANGKTFSGWKGGEYTMDNNTAVWVANAGDSHGVAIVDVVETQYSIWLQTELID